ncbi:sulfotransferase domain-containing protein [Salinibacter sp.]|uniref:sulfotransferase domain-containing protein n=1 Tax=Salinibacter sp. TaxID=2065818 RepID=UPI003D6DF061
MCRPTFLVIGTQKAGTTWIADMLRQHSSVCMPEKKEIHFFNKKRNYKKGFEWYEEHFRSCNAPVRGEATPNYLWTSDDPHEIQESGRTNEIPKIVHDTYPDLKFIVSLRDPVERAISAYRTLIRGGYISPRKSILQVADRHGILSMGEYQTHIERWLNHFPRSKFLFLLFEEEVKGNRNNTIKRMYRFLDVNDQFVPENVDVRKHPSLGSFYENLLYYAPWLRSVANMLAPNLDRDRIPFRDLLDQPAVDNEERSKLCSYFEGRNQRLGEMIGRQPSWVDKYA